MIKIIFDSFKITSKLVQNYFDGTKIMFKSIKSNIKIMFEIDFVKYKLQIS